MKKIISLVIMIIGLFVGSAVAVGVYQGITSDNTNTKENVEIKEEIKMELKEVEIQTGFYVVGKDIQQGTYDIVHIDGQGLVGINEEDWFQIGTDRDYGDTEIVKNVELKEGDKIEVTGGLLFKFVPVEK